MGETSDDSERFSSSPLLLYSADAFIALVLSHSADAKPSRLAPHTVETDAAWTGLVAAVPHIVEITLTVNIVVIASRLLPSQFVATAE